MRIISESFTDYAIISMDAEGRVESWNAGAENIFGFTADEILGKSSAILFTPEDVARGVPAEELHKAERLGRASDERWHMRKDGTRFFASGVAAPLYVGEKLTGFAKIATDLTEKKRNAEALQRAYDEMENRVLERTRELASMNETLMREISERQTAERQKIELLKRLVSGQEEERRRIARDLHDHLGQRLTALRLKLASLREACAGDEELYGRATRLQQIAELIDSEVSFLAWELRPSTLDELGLIDAIGAFVKEWSRHYEVNAEFHSAGLGDVRLDREAETHLYRITQEALNNIYKHADAHNVSVLVERAGREVILIIEDDGAGFAQSEAQKDRKGNRGLGLGGMKERADLIGGTLEIESEVGKGTTIYVRIPVEPDQGLNDER
jgi:PAS domain S-box-containing protein